CASGRGGARASRHILFPVRNLVPARSTEQASRSHRRSDMTSGSVCTRNVCTSLRPHATGAGMFARRIFRSVCASAFAAAVALSILACSNALAGNALPRWETLPPVPALPAPERSGHADVNGIRMYYAIFGHGLPVLLIHNGLGSADDWGGVVPILARDHTVIVADTRGFGRSTLGNQPLTYPLLAEDYVSLLQALRLHPVYLVGTSDGGIIGLDIALHHPQLLSGMFIQGANINKDGIQTSPPDLTAVRLALQRSKSEYTRLSATPDAYARFRGVYN